MPGKVVLFNSGTEPVAFYERKRHESLARIIAEIKNYDFAGAYDPGCHRTSHLYFVPHHTILATELADEVGIHTTDDLFGGVVPYWFVATKAVIHGVAHLDAARPAKWDDDLSK